MHFKESYGLHLRRYNIKHSRHNSRCFISLVVVCLFVYDLNVIRNKFILYCTFKKIAFNNVKLKNIAFTHAIDSISFEQTL